MTAADRRKSNKDAGFSLLELLIAVVILAIIVIPLLNLFLSSNRLNIKSRQTLRATTAAQDIMEGLKAYNINEIKEQFKDPASGFYVIDSRLIKGGVAEEPSLEVDPSGNPAKGLYVFSMKDVTLQGSRFDAKIVVDGSSYMTGSLTHKEAFNDAALADARSIDKKNGTFVEEEKIRQAVLTSIFKNSGMKTVFNDSTMEAAIKNRLKSMGIPNAELDAAYQDLQNEKKPDSFSIKGCSAFFDRVGRTLTVDLTVSAEVDEDGRPKVDMKVTEVYEFTIKDASGTDVTMTTSGDMGSLIEVNNMSCGSVERMLETDKTTGADVEKINVNLFYYPLYGSASPDKIIINNSSGANLNLLIAKQRHETADPSDPTLPNLDDPEYLTDPRLMIAEQAYKAEIEMNDTYGFDPDNFSLKTNLGLNLVGKKYAGASIDLPTQFSVKGKSLSQLNIFTLDGVRSTLGKPGTPGEATELIYDVEVSVYEEGAAAAGFPDDKRMVVIGGSTTN